MNKESTVSMLARLNQGKKNISHPIDFYEKNNDSPSLELSPGSKLVPDVKKEANRMEQVLKNLLNPGFSSKPVKRS